MSLFSVSLSPSLLLLLSLSLSSSLYLLSLIGLPVGSSPRVSPKPPPVVALTDIDLQKNKDNNDDSSIDDKSTRL